jgi:hypothetical protein
MSAPAPQYDWQQTARNLGIDSVDQLAHVAESHGMLLTEMPELKDSANAAARRLWYYLLAFSFPGAKDASILESVPTVKGVSAALESLGAKSDIDAPADPNHYTSWQTIKDAYYYDQIYSEPPVPTEEVRDASLDSDMYAQFFKSALNTLGALYVPVFVPIATGAVQPTAEQRLGLAKAEHLNVLADNPMPVNMTASNASAIAATRTQATQALGRLAATAGAALLSASAALSSSTPTAAAATSTAATATARSAQPTLPEVVRSFWPSERGPGLGEVLRSGVSRPASPSTAATVGSVMTSAKEALANFFSPTSHTAITRFSGGSAAGAGPTVKEVVAIATDLLVSGVATEEQLEGMTPMQLVTQASALRHSAATAGHTPAIVGREHPATITLSQMLSGTKRARSPLDDSVGAVGLADTTKRRALYTSPTDNNTTATRVAVALGSNNLVMKPTGIFVADDVPVATIATEGDVINILREQAATAPIGSTVTVVGPNVRGQVIKTEPRPGVVEVDTTVDVNRQASASALSQWSRQPHTNVVVDDIVTTTTTASAPPRPTFANAGTAATVDSNALSQLLSASGLGTAPRANTAASRSATMRNPLDFD